jgi:glycosyltransferase involved in cell wall biosynthesis
MPHDPSDRLDVLLLLGAFQLRGSYQRALSLAESLPTQRIRLRVVSSDPVRLSSGRRKHVETRVSRYLNWPVLCWLARGCLASDLRGDPPDLIDVQHRSLHAAGVRLARQLQRPYSLTIHDYLRDRERLVIDPQWCRRVVAVSESVRTELIEHTRLPEALVTVIPSGVQPPDACELPSILEEERRPVIGAAGPLEPGKGLQHFLRAAAQVLKSRPDALFLIAGSGPEERTLRRLAVDLNLQHALTFLPNLQDFGPALKAMDVFVLPSLKQGLGTTMLEAMAHGLPVVATESGGVFSVVQSGQTGLLVPPGTDPDRARDLGTAARQWVMERFHVQNMVAATTTLYSQIACSSVAAM